MVRKSLHNAPTLAALHKWNWWLAGLHTLQAFIVLLLSASKTFPISASFLSVDSLQSTTTGDIVLAPATHHLFDLNMMYLVAAFFLMSAMAHVLMATAYRSKYEADLAKGINRLRWFEYAISASTMLVGIAVLTGMYDAVSLGLVFVLSAVMNLLGLVMETSNPVKGRTKINWSSYLVGCIAGLAPWLGVAFYLFATNVYGSGQVPGFVYGIYVSLFVFFGCFAVNMYLQYQKIGPWKDYLYGERWYMILSLVAKSALAWQVFFGALRP
ncbi:heliorhodopsin HeR [Candidatus Saccharibacteria bacterium]|nr:heliorhodopsin HeR [Candidatus Saccharibacteria bacterium]